MIEKCSGGPTKPEIISISLSKLQLQPTDLMADIGCGSGAITLEAAKKVHHIYAIDHRNIAIKTTQQNLQHHNIHNADLIKAEATEALSTIEKIDCAFIGGTQNIGQTLQTATKKGATRLVVNAVRIETVSKTIQCMKKLNIFSEALHVTVSKSHTLEGETMFKPDNPVYIIVAKKGDTSC